MEAPLPNVKQILSKPTVFTALNLEEFDNLLDRLVRRYNYSVDFTVQSVEFIHPISIIITKRYTLESSVIEYSKTGLSDPSIIRVILNTTINLNMDQPVKDCDLLTLFNYISNEKKPVFNVPTINKVFIPEPRKIQIIAPPPKKRGSRLKNANIEYRCHSCGTTETRQWRYPHPNSPEANKENIIYCNSCGLQARKPYTPRTNKRRRSTSGNNEDLSDTDVEEQTSATLVQSK